MNEQANAARQKCFRVLVPQRSVNHDAAAAAVEKEKKKARQKTSEELKTNNGGEQTEERRTNVHLMTLACDSKERETRQSETEPMLGLYRSHLCRVREGGFV